MLRVNDRLLRNVFRVTHAIQTVRETPAGIAIQAFLLSLCVMMALLGLAAGLTVVVLTAWMATVLLLSAGLGVKRLDAYCRARLSASPATIRRLERELGMAPSQTENSEQRLFNIQRETWADMKRVLDNAQRTSLPGHERLVIKSGPPPRPSVEEDDYRFVFAPFLIGESTTLDEAQLALLRERIDSLDGQLARLNAQRRQTQPMPPDHFWDNYITTADGKAPCRRHRWVTQRSTSLHIYRECAKCHRRKVDDEPGMLGYQPVDEQWLAGGNWKHQHPHQHQWRRWSSGDGQSFGMVCLTCGTWCDV